MARITPEAAEAFMLNAGYKPLEPYKKSHGKWKCIHLACGEIVFPSYHGLHQGQGGCRPCGRKVGADKKRLSESVTVPIMLKANLQPLVPYKDTDTPWKSRCLLCNRVVQPRFAAIKAGQGGCGYCAGNFVDVISAIKDMKLANLLPLVEFTKSHDEWKSECLLCGRVVFPTYNSIQQGNGGCKYCAGKFVDAQEAKEFMVGKGLKPLELFHKADKKWKCKCLICGKIVTPTYSSIRIGNGGCIHCAGLVIEPKKAVALMKSKKLKPLVPFKSSHTKWKCKCLVCGRTVYPTYNYLHQGNGPCGYCAGKIVDVKEAMHIMKSAGLKPLDPYTKALDRWRCECQKCGRIVTPTYSAIKKGQGCRFCAEIGIDYTGPGFIYLMTHQLLQSHKVGIGGSKRSRNRDRVIDHQKSGWKLYSRKDFETADIAFQIEQKVIDWLRQEKNLGIYLSEFEMPQGGYTETVDASEIDLPTIWAKVEELSKVKKKS
jgi:recombinational DNA repair protein (RecF pathway)